MKRILTALTVGIFLASSLYAENDKLDQSLRDKIKGFKDQKNQSGKDKDRSADKGKERVRVILRTDPSQSADVDRESARLGGKQLKKFSVLSGSVVELPLEMLEQLSKHKGIKGISQDALLDGKQTTTLTSHIRVTTGDQTAASTYGATGAGIGIAIIDSGIANVPDLPNVVKSLNFTGDGRGPRSDPFGHGTHVAGLAAGNGSLSNGLYKGIAPGASLVDLRVLNEDGAGYTSDVIEAIEWAMTNRNAMGTNGKPMNIRVINLSLGHAPFESTETDPLAIVCRTAVNQGMVVVAAAGNYGKDSVTGEPIFGGITSPGTEKSVITVGAMTTWGTDSRSDDTLASYSSRGPTFLDGFAKPDIAAPGSNLVAPKSPGNKLITMYPQLDVAGNYMKLSGTSMSAPIVSGTAALILEEQPGLKPNGLKAVLMYTAEKRVQNLMEVGAGELNGAGAMNMAVNLNPKAASKAYWLLNNGWGLNYSNVIGGSPAVWGQMLKWGNTVYTGGSMLHYNDPAWNETIVWGDTIVWSDTIVWGDTIVWDDTIVWGDTIVWADTVLWGESTAPEDF